MSLHTYSDIVPFVIHCISEAEPSGNDDWFKVFSTECWAEEYGTQAEQDSIYSLKGQRFSVRNWTYEGSVHIGKRKRILAFSWKCGDALVSLVNESPYESGGSYMMAVVANDEASIQKFLTDFADLVQNNFGIETIDTVEQTL